MCSNNTEDLNLSGNLSWAALWSVGVFNETVVPSGECLSIFLNFTIAFDSYCGRMRIRLSTQTAPFQNRSLAHRPSYCRLFALSEILALGRPESRYRKPQVTQKSVIHYSHGAGGANSYGWMVDIILLYSI